MSIYGYGMDFKWMLNGSLHSEFHGFLQIFSGLLWICNGLLSFVWDLDGFEVNIACFFAFVMLFVRIIVGEFALWFLFAQDLFIWLILSNIDGVCFRWNHQPELEDVLMPFCTQALFCKQLQCRQGVQEQSAQFGGCRPNCLEPGSIIVLEITLKSLYKVISFSGPDTAEQSEMAAGTGSQTNDLCRHKAGGSSRCLSCTWFEKSCRRRCAMDGGWWKSKVCEKLAVGGGYSQIPKMIFQGIVISVAIAKPSFGSTMAFSGGLSAKKTSQDPTIGSSGRGSGSWKLAWILLSAHSQCVAMELCILPGFTPLLLVCFFFRNPENNAWKPVKSMG